MEIQTKPEAPARRHVVIIGSGIAALSAAQTLLGLGNCDLTLLEGRNRVGGRIFTDTIGPKNVPVNLGAHFIHGCESPGCNLLLDFCRKHNIPTVDSSCESETIFTGEKPNQIVAALSVQRAHECLQALDEHLPLMTETSDTLRNVLHQLPAVSTLESDEKLVLENILQSKHAYAASPETISIAGVQDQLKRHHHHRVDHASCGQRILPFGYGSIVQHLARGLARYVRLGDAVCRIKQGPRSCTVTTVHGKQYDCDAVIVTVTLGVLKARKILFEPPLPRKKVAAIDRLGFGVQNRVYMNFESIFWDPEVRTFHCCRDTRFQFFNMAAHGLGPLLSVIVRPPFSEEMQMMDDTAVLKEILNVLRTMFSEVTSPTSHKITRWGRDPFARGSFSYIPSGASLHDVRDLAKPEGLVFFAGEATSDEEMQMARGAFTSGIRAAGEVMAYLADAVEAGPPALSAPTQPANTAQTSTTAPQLQLSMPQASHHAQPRSAQPWANNAVAPWPAPMMYYPGPYGQPMMVPPSPSMMGQPGSHYVPPGMAMGPGMFMPQSLMHGFPPGMTLGATPYGMMPMPHGMQMAMTVRPHAHAHPHPHAQSHALAHRQHAAVVAEQGDREDSA